MVVAMETRWRGRLRYTCEFTLTHFVQVMLDVAIGYRPSPRAAFFRRDLALIASISAYYRKLNRMEMALSEAVVRGTAVRARRPITAGGGLMPEPVDGYAARILDGDVLTGTEHPVGPCAPLGRPACRACRWRSTSRPAD
jgi:hypothetical protein